MGCCEGNGPMKDNGAKSNGSWGVILAAVGVAVIVMMVVAIRLGGSNLKYLLPGKHEQPVKMPRRPTRPPVRLSDFIAELPPDAVSVQAARCIERWQYPKDVRKTLQALLRRAEERAPAYQALFPTGKDVHLYRDFTRKRRAWRRRIHVETYDRYGSKNPKWDAQAREFLARIAERFEGNLDYKLRDALYKQSSALIKAGCDDPFVLYCHGNLEHYIHGAEAAEPYVSRGLKGLLESGYPRFYAFWAARRLTDICRQIYGGDSEDAKVLEKKSLFYLGQAAADAIFQPDMVRAYAEAVGLVTGNVPYARADLFKAILEGLDSVENPDPWAAAYCRAVVHKMLAWKARGTGWSYTVTRKGWENFEDEMKTAREAAETAWKLHPDLPEPACVMIDIAMATCSKDEVREWFRRAVAAEFDADSAYGTFSWSLLPRWGGSMTEQAAFGLACFHTDRFDTTVPWQAIRSLTNISMDLHEHWRDLWLLPEAQEIVDRYYEKMAQQYKPVPSADFLRRMAVFAWAAGRYERADEILRKIVPRHYPRVGEICPYNVPDMTMFHEVAVGAGKAGPEARRVLEDLDRGDVAAAAARYLENTDAILKRMPEAAFVLMERIGAVRGAPPLDDPAFIRNLTAIWGRLGYYERIARACSIACVPSNAGAAADALRKEAVKQCGPYVPAFAEVVPADAVFDLRTVESTLDAVRRRAEELRIENEVQPGSDAEKELETARLIAEVRCLLQAVVKDRNRPQGFIDRVVMPRLKRVPLKGRLIDFISEVGWQSQHGDPLPAYFAFKFYNAIQRPIEDDYNKRAAIQNRLAAVQDEQELIRACRQAWLEHGGCRIALQCARLLRERGLPAEAAWYEHMVGRWAVNFCSLSTTTYSYWALWQAVDVYNSVRGYETQTLLYGEPLAAAQGLNSTHYMIAHAYIRQGRYEDAVWAIMYGKALRDDQDMFCTPDGVFQNTQEYVAALIRMLESRKELSDDWKKALKQTFPELFLKGIGARPDQAPVLPDRP